MKIKTVEFLQRSRQLKETPDKKKPEYAFIGRSNVGKSSLINSLCNQKKLAPTSSKPGKTQGIDHYIVNNEWYLVDLPGYGWSRVSKKEKDRWKKMLEDYMLYRQNLQCLFVLIDSRIPPQETDLEFMEWLGEEAIPFAMIFTKTDKQKSNKLQSFIADYKKTMLKTWEFLPDYFITSSVTGKGQEAILEFIEHLNENYHQNKPDG